MQLAVLLPGLLHGRASSGDEALDDPIGVPDAVVCPVPGRDNALDGGAGADRLTGNAGNDTFVFHAGEADGDVVVDFAGNGAGAGDSFEFIGFGTTAQGATFTSLGGNTWQIHSGLDAHNETIALSNGASIHATDFVFV
jgi:Ca2+-binding RTX toxin-like protein